MLLFSLLLGATRAAPASQPNIILILTDDLDYDMYGMNPLNKTRQLIGSAGATFTNAFVSTPICCPSRSTILTGRYQHNTRVYNNTVVGGCNSNYWRQELEPKSIGVTAQSLGYETYYAGKYLNQYGMDSAGGIGHVPPGWKHWNGLVGNSRYYNYTISRNGQAEQHGDNFTTDYYTDVIKRDSVKFIKNHADNKQPLFMVIAPPAPHQPWDADPKYKGLFDNITASDFVHKEQYNVKKTDGHWLLRAAPSPMTANSTNWANEAFRGRWETLMSVDDLVADVYDALKSSKKLDNSYIIFTSDHGYHTGQFSLPYDKRQMYDFDLRIPLLVRGPTVTPGSTVSQPVISTDFAPTLIELMSVSEHEYLKTTYDGISLVPFLDGKSDLKSSSTREDMLIEYQGESDATIPGCEKLNNQNLAECIPQVDCMCDDAKNNTFSCVRRIKIDAGNVTDNVVYCEFVDTENFIEVYDMKTDPFQLQNVRNSMDPQQLQNLNDQLILLSTCSGVKCSTIASIDEETNDPAL